MEDVCGNRWRRDGFASCKGKLVCVVFGASLRTCTGLIDVSCCFRDFQSVSFLIKSSNELQTLNQVSHALHLEVFKSVSKVIHLYFCFAFTTRHLSDCLIMPTRFSYDCREN